MSDQPTVPLQERIVPPVIVPIMIVVAILMAAWMA
jgi:hypothetical protein